MMALHALACVDCKLGLRLAGLLTLSHQRVVTGAILVPTPTFTYSSFIAFGLHTQCAAPWLWC